MLNRFNDHISTNLVFLKDTKIILAISGGLDSVVLAHLCKELNLNFSLAHCNFNLRGEESNGDENFVLELADQLDVEIFVQNFDTKDYADLNKLSIQMAARELRYNWFKELAYQLNFDYILTAHHADDNLETFLINFTRGTGLNGLTGIPVLNNNIARPLLPFSREELASYAREKSIIWREDSSNSSRKYLRNKLRHEVVPILKEINPQLLSSLNTTLINLNDTVDIVDDCLTNFQDNAIIKEDHFGIHYKISEFKKTRNPRAYIFETFKDFGFTEWKDVLSLLDAQSGKQVLSKTHRLIKHRDAIILARHQTDSNTSYEISKSDTSIKTPIGLLHIEVEHGKIKPAKNIIYVDRDKLQFPLKLRVWEQGDSFYPLGMSGKKKVSKFLKDEKTSLLEKENTWLLLTKSDVIWVVGKRADNRYKVEGSTNKILKIELI